MISHNHADFLLSLPLPSSPFYLSLSVCLSLSPSLSFSILNKLTPEKFDKLCLELLNVGVDSKLVLKGIILLVSVDLFTYLSISFFFSLLFVKWKIYSSHSWQPALSDSYLYTTCFNDLSGPSVSPPPPSLSTLSSLFFSLWCRL